MRLHQHHNQQQQQEQPRACRPRTRLSSCQPVLLAAAVTCLASHCHTWMSWQRQQQDRLVLHQVLQSLLLVVVYLPAVVWGLLGQVAVGVWAVLGLCQCPSPCAAVAAPP